MSNKDEPTGTARSDGDPDTIDSLAAWARDLEKRIRRSIDLCRMADYVSRTGWMSLDGEGFRHRLESGIDSLAKTADLAGSVAAILHRYASDLRRAQSLVDRAAALTREYGFPVDENGVVRPVFQEGIEIGNAQSVLPLPLDKVPLGLIDPRFRQIAGLSHAAMDIINPADNYIDVVLKNLRDDDAWIAGDFVAAGTKKAASDYLAKVFGRESRKLADASWRRDNLRRLLSLMRSYGRQFGGMPDLIEMAEVEAPRWAAEASRRTLTKAASGLVSKVVKHGGGILTTAGFVTEVATGTPLDTALVGVAGSLAGGVLGEAIFGPIGGIAGGAFLEHVAKATYQSRGPDHRPVIVTDRWYLGAFEER